MATYDRQAAIAAQKAYCEREETPHFAPNDGFCYYCNRNIYDAIKNRNGRTYGVSVEKAGSTLITGCPHCNYSFVE